MFLSPVTLTWSRRTLRGAMITESRRRYGALCNFCCCKAVVACPRLDAYFHPRLSRASDFMQKLVRTDVPWSFEIVASADLGDEVSGNDIRACIWEENIFVKKVRIIRNNHLIFLLVQNCRRIKWHLSKQLKSVHGNRRTFEPRPQFEPRRVAKPWGARHDHHGISWVRRPIEYHLEELSWAYHETRAG